MACGVAIVVHTEFLHYICNQFYRLKKRVMALMGNNSGGRRIDRLDQFIASQQLNDNRVTIECGLSVGTLGKSRKPGKDMSVKTATAILERYPRLNKVWLLTGVGDMLTFTQPASYHTYPVVDFSKSMYGNTFCLDFSYQADDMEFVSVPGIPAETEFFIQATGHSMLNCAHPELSIPNGALVGLCRVQGNMLRWGEVYALYTEDGITLKRLMPGNGNTIRCLSYNSDDYPEYSVKRDEINDVARVTCVVPVFVR